MRTPKRKIHPCFNCGKEATGKLCMACELKQRKKRWTKEKRQKQSIKIANLWNKRVQQVPSKKLLLSKHLRHFYFCLKYGGIK